VGAPSLLTFVLTFDFMVITGPCGVLVVFPMFSGTRLHGSKGTIKFWWEMLVDLGIGTHADQRRLAKQIWKVGSIYTTLTFVFLSEFFPAAAVWLYQILRV
jgi:hypothetical protein